MDTKEKHKKELSELIRDHSNFELVFTDGYRNFLVCLRKTISERITDEKFLITTRLDNDDCIRNDYVQLIQQEFDRQNKCILDFPKGLSIEIEPKTRLAYRRIRLNPFISLVESIDSFQTVMNFFRHRGWEKSNAIIQTIRNVRPWMQVVHEKNKSNSFKGLFLCSRYELIKPFGLLMPADIIKPGLFKKIQHFVIVFYNRSRYRLRIILEKING